MRKIENAKKESIGIIIGKIKAGIISVLNDYFFIFNIEEKNILLASLKLIEEYLNTQRVELLDSIFRLEQDLKPYIFRCFEYEKNNGSRYISWLKDDSYNPNKVILSTTFGNTDGTFCDSKIGIVYDISIDAFLGACNKDAATIKENSDRESIYTIFHMDDNSIINSYNYATTIVTPIQLFDNKDNTYISKHNEIILDSKYATPIGIICLSDFYINFANEISEKYNIPIIYPKTK